MRAISDTHAVILGVKSDGRYFENDLCEARISGGASNYSSYSGLLDFCE